MIPVTKAIEPADFDEKVRKKGLRALSELVGDPVSDQRRGKPRLKMVDSRDQIPADKFPPYWTAALPDMLREYQRTCAYLALYLEYATGNPSVDHMKPKSQTWDQVYEWSNYRLASTFINAKKNNLALALDPFEIQAGTFALEFTAFQVKPGPAALGSIEVQAHATIEMLGLNREPCCSARAEYVENYLAGEITLGYLARRAPFIAQELSRQERLLPDDVLAG
jgi:hypothetical protein